LNHWTTPSFLSSDVFHYEFHCVAKIHCYSKVGQWISPTMVELMQNAINMSSSFIAFLFQFHMHASYLITLLCFMNKMKLSKCCSIAILVGRQKVRCDSPVDLTWLIMVRTTSCANFSKFPKVKLVRDLKGPGVTHMVPHTYIRVDRLSTFFIQHRWYEIFSSVDTNNYHLHCNPIIYHNFLKQHLIATQVKMWQKWAS